MINIFRELKQTKGELIMAQKWYVKIKDGKVVQKQPYFEEGFIILTDNNVVPGYLYDEKNKTYTCPPPSENIEE